MSTELESIKICSQFDLDLCRLILKNLNIHPYDTRASQSSFTSDCYINIKFSRNYYFISARRECLHCNIRYFLDNYLSDHIITFQEKRSLFIVY